MTASSAFKVTDEYLVKGYYGLAQDFLEADNPLKADETASSSVEDAEAKEVAEEMEAMARTIVQKVDDLMITRLTANNRKVPLLSTADADRIIADIFKGQVMDEELSVVMNMARWLTNTAIAIKTKGFLSAIVSDDMYDAFWQFTFAIIEEVVDRGITPKEVVSSFEARASVYRKCIGYDSWRKLSVARVAVLSGIMPSTFLNNLSSAMSDEDIAEMEEKLPGIDSAYNAGFAEKLKGLKKFYADLGRRIWPADQR